MSTAVLDIGKTNLKLLLIDADGRILAERQRPNRSLRGPPWPALDVAGMEAWLLEGLDAFARGHALRHVVAASHGSAAVLVDDAGPVLPPIDYEAEPPEAIVAAHRRLAPPFPERGSAFLGGASHYARQLLWMRAVDPAAVARARALLPLPQYLAWRLTGGTVIDWTMLGAQSHLWSPLGRNWTALVDRLDVARLLPSPGPPWRRVGRVHPRFGLPAGLEALAGVHDSTANLYRYQRAGLGRFTLLSTGTWIVGMSAGTPVHRLDERRGMGLTSDVAGAPIAGTLAMGGREHALIAGERPAAVTAEALEAVVAAGVMVRPGLVGFDGIFAGSAGTGAVLGELGDDAARRAALATLYTALVSAVCLELLAAEDTVVIDGGFTAEPAFAGLLAALRPDLRVLVCPTGDGTARGAALLASHGTDRPVPLELIPAEPLAVSGLAGYRARWRALVDDAGTP